MPKYYINYPNNPKRNLIRDAANKGEAADRFVDYWNERQIVVSGYVTINETGFPSPFAGSVNTDEIIQLSAA